jgi:hypothetical protein
MLDALSTMAAHARDIDAELDLRKSLAAAQAEGQVYTALHCTPQQQKGQAGPHDSHSPQTLPLKLQEHGCSLLATSLLG